ncbi:hypothetical protein D3C79_593410 [compost metagenome]
MFLFHQPAFGGHVEFALVRIEQRHRGRPGDIPGQHRFVDLAPEGVTVFPLDARVGQAGMDHMRQHIERDRQRRGENDIGVQQQERQRRGKENQPRNAGQEVQHGVGVTQPLRQFQPLAEQRVIQPENLHHAARPTNALANVRRQAFGRQPGGLRNTDIGRGVPATMQTQRGVGIFGDGFHRDAAYLIQRAAAQDGARAAKEGRIPHIVAVLHQAVEQRAFVRGLAETPEVALKRIRRKEVMRGLQHRQLLVFEEPAHGQLQEGASRYVVAVENRHKLAGGLLQRVVDVAGLGVLMGRPGDILHPHLFGEGFEFRSVAVIEEVDIDLLFRPIDTQRGVDRRFHHPKIFVVGRHHQIDRRPGRAVGRQRHRLAVKRPDGLEIAQNQHHPGIGFRRQQQQAADQAERIVPVQRGGVAPPKVAAGNGQRQYDQHQPRQTARYPTHHHRNAPQQHHKHKLRRQIEGLRNAQHGEDRRQYADNDKQHPAHAPVHLAQTFH